MDCMRDHCCCHLSVYSVAIPYNNYNKVSHMYTNLSIVVAKGASVYLSNPPSALPAAIKLAITPVTVVTITTTRAEAKLAK